MRTARASMVVALFGILPAFTNIHVGTLQPEDFLLLLLMAFCLAEAILSGFTIRVVHELGGLLKSYGSLLFVLLALALLAFRLKFFPLQKVSFLIQPGLLSISRLIQFSAVVCGFLWLTNAFLKHKSSLYSAMTLYWRTGIFSATYALLCSAAILVLHLNPTYESMSGAYLPDDLLRARGFFVEGGPFGLYLVSVFAIGILRRHATKQPIPLIGAGIVGLAFLLSSSKAGFFAAAILVLYFVTAAASFKRKVISLALSSAVLVGAAVWMDLDQRVLGYVAGYEALQTEAASVSDDTSLIAGRIAAAVIVPKMISAHPWTGIGIGNYSLMRNDPDYLGYLPPLQDLADLPGIGIPGTVAEIGIPATLWLFFLLLKPYSVSRRGAAIVSAIALFQPIAHALGVQLTFFYPWFVAACALAAHYHDPLNVGRLRSELPGH